MITASNIEIDDLKEILSMSESEANYHFDIVRWGWEWNCPYCTSFNVGLLCGNTRRYKCYDCRKQFGNKVGTIFQGSRLTMRQWFLLIYFMDVYKIYSSYGLANIIGASQKSTYYATKKIKNSICIETPYNNIKLREYIEKEKPL